MKKVSLKLSGLSCGGCISAVKSAIEGSGGKDVKITIDRAEFYIGNDEDVQKFISAIESSGYKAEVEKILE
jgi:copper chaperone CopZ